MLVSLNVQFHLLPLNKSSYISPTQLVIFTPNHVPFPMRQQDL